MAETTEPAKRYDFDRVVRMLLSAGTALAVILLLRYLSDVLAPVAVAALLAYLLNPVVTRLDARIRKRGISVALTVLGVVGLILGSMAVVGPILISQISDFSGMVGSMEGAGQIEGAFDGTGPGFHERYQSFKSARSAGTQDLLTQVELMLADVKWSEVLLKAATRLAPGVWGVVSGALSLLLGLTVVVVVLLYLFFLLMDYPLYAGRWKEFLPPAYREPVVGFIDEFVDAMRRYFRGQFVIAGTVGVLFVIGFWLIGLRMSVLLGLFIGLLNMVPYLQLAGLVPAMLLGLVRAIENAGPDGDPQIVWSLALVLIVFAVVQLIQDAVLTPRILGKSTGLRPLVILLGVCVWGKLLGFLGLVLAIPLTCIGLAYYRKFILERVESRSGAGQKS
ncbi:MAG: AI-2E family transporter [Planctomycetes bacterium]|nr:AI-2E family transporter [Planctomycetota bacterium]